MVKQKSYTYGNYGGYSGYSGNRPPYSGAPYNPLPGSKKDEKDDKGGKKSDKKSEQKSEKTEKPRTRIGAGWQGKNSCQQSMWDEDDDGSVYPYGGYSDQYLGGE